jgi:hypothetical protein
LATHIKPKAETIGTLIAAFAPGVSGADLCNWPPDAFAIAGSLLQVSGIYSFAVTKRWQKSGESVERIVELGRQWRRRAGRSERAPSGIATRWRRILRARKLRVSELSDPRHEKLRHSLFDLIGAADEACKNAGFPYPYSVPDPFLDRAAAMLHNCLEEGRPSTLCGSVIPSAVCVLPKRHVPQVGMTFRSLTHYLALCRVGEAHPTWVNGGATTTGIEKGDELRLLLVPYPAEIHSRQFRIVRDEQCGRYTFPPNHRHFDYAVDKTATWLRTHLPTLLENAGRVDGVIFPELSLASMRELVQAFEITRKKSSSAFVLAGVEQRQVGKPCFNSAMYVMPVSEKAATMFVQRKHHRWKLNKSQIEMYGLDDTLDTGLALWENADIGDRQLNFFAVRQSLAFCFLICEDLARQEPVTRLVRAVGPDLVIALLMDGPQLKTRWPARYASVLAEDPGSSVLTLTNIGLVARTWGRAPTKSRVVALWSDRSQPPKEISLARNADAVLLTLTRRSETEYSADGRSNSDTAYFVLDKPHEANIRQISSKKRLKRRAAR